MARSHVSPGGGCLESAARPGPGLANVPGIVLWAQCRTPAKSPSSGAGQGKMRPRSPRCLPIRKRCFRKSQNPNYSKPKRQERTTVSYKIDDESVDESTTGILKCLISYIRDSFRPHSYQPMKPRRFDPRQRALASCLSCKAKKTRCSDFRPCARCSYSGLKNCVDGYAKQPSKSSSSLDDAPSETTAGYPVFKAISRFTSRLLREPQPHIMTDIPTMCSSNPSFATVVSASVLDSQANASASSRSAGSVQEAMPSHRQSLRIATTLPKWQNHDQWQIVTNQHTSRQIGIPPYDYAPYLSEDRPHSQGRPQISSSAICIRENRGAKEWVWEALAGPGEEDPFRDDWKQSQLLWEQGETAAELVPPAVD